MAIDAIRAAGPPHRPAARAGAVTKPANAVKAISAALIARIVTHDVPAFVAARIALLVGLIGRCTSGQGEGARHDQERKKARKALWLKHHSLFENESGAHR